MSENKECCIHDESSFCEYRGTWICKNPDCKTPVLTSTLIGARPSGSPYYDKWNSKKSLEERKKEDGSIH